MKIRANKILLQVARARLARQDLQELLVFRAFRVDQVHWVHQVHRAGQGLLDSQEVPVDQDPSDLPEVLGSPAHKASLDHPEAQAFWDHQDRKEQQAFLEEWVSLGVPVSLELPALRDHQDFQDHKVSI